MIDEYRRGRTPNPDVMCNREIKFGGFKKWALAEGADFVATGHYAEVRQNKQGDYELVVSKDSEKDQTYFLWKLNQEDLKHILFPVGHLKKEDVRKLATKFGLPTAAKKDSQGICMLGAIDMKDFLRQYIDVTEGVVNNEGGKQIGVHPGSIFFTLGERHGFTITDKESIGKVFYVIAKDVTQNSITVSADPAHSTQAKERQECLIEQINLISDIPLHTKLTARLRYRAELISCELIEKNSKTARVRFTEPQVTASPGQSLVFYRDDSCLGGGIIA
jgi:tRNA-specific 2-thiouridylase